MGNKLVYNYLDNNEYSNIYLLSLTSINKLLKCLKLQQCDNITLHLTCSIKSCCDHFRCLPREKGVSDF